MAAAPCRRVGSVRLGKPRHEGGEHPVGFFDAPLHQHQPLRRVNSTVGFTPMRYSFSAFTTLCSTPPLPTQDVDTGADPYFVVPGAPHAADKPRKTPPAQNQPQNGLVHLRKEKPMTDTPDDLPSPDDFRRKTPTSPGVRGCPPVPVGCAPKTISSVR